MCEIKKKKKKKDSEIFTEQAPAIAAELGLVWLMVVTRVFTVLNLELCQALAMEPHVLRINKGILMIMNDWKIRFLSDRNGTAMTGMRR